MNKERVFKDLGELGWRQMHNPHETHWEFRLPEGMPLVEEGVIVAATTMRKLGYHTELIQRVVEGNITTVQFSSAASKLVGIRFYADSN